MDALQAQRNIIALTVPVFVRLEVKADVEGLSRMCQRTR